MHSIVLAAAPQFTLVSEIIHYIISQNATLEEQAQLWKMASRIRVLSERIMTRGFESTASRSVCNSKFVVERNDSTCHRVQVHAERAGARLDGTGAPFHRYNWCF